MPQPGVQLLILLAAVPLQYLVSKWMTPVAVDREYLTRRYIYRKLLIIFLLEFSWKRRVNAIND